MTERAATRTSCSSCREPVFPDDTFCPACGLAVAEMTTGAGTSQPSNPSGAVLLTRAETRALTGVLTKYAAEDQPCASCQRRMGPEERFCAGCGKLRAGLDPAKVGRGESRTEQAWREVQDKLQAATAGRYEISRELGRGGMAAVYLAKEISLNRQVAIKVMRPSLLLDEGMVERFNREARTMAALHHPNIVAIHAVEEANDLHFFVMQYIPGRALDEVIRASGPQPVAAVQALIYQAAAALTHAHRQGVIHRDIKPGNIMLDLDGNAIVTDFGIAKVADVQATSATVGAMGTPLYMSPEQCAGGALTPAADQYALGNVAYELLTGKPPFERPSAMALGLAILHEPPPPPRAARPDLPPDIEAALLTMLAKRPEARFATLSEAAAALGGEALAEDDPIRQYLREVAKRSGKADGRRLTPKSSRSTGLGRGRFTGLAGAKLRRILAGGLITGLALIGALIAYRARRNAVPAAPASAPNPPTVPVAVPPPAIPPPLAPPPAPPGEDPAATVARLTAAGRQALRARQWDRAAADLGAALALDPSSRQLKALIGQVGEGRRADSAARASQSSTPANPPAPAPTSSPPAPPPAPAEPPPLPPPASARPTHEAELRQAIDEYVRAINARNMGRLKAIFPGLSGEQESAWRDRFGKDVRKLTATGSVRRVEESSDQAEVAFVLELVLEPDGGDPLNYRIRSDAVLKNIGGAWRIVSLIERGG